MFENKKIKLPLLIIVFFYLYSVQFIFFGGVGSRAIMGLLGAGLFVFSVTNMKSSLKKIRIAVSLLMISVVSLISIFINRTTDFEFIIYPISVVLILFAGYFVYYFFRQKYNEINFALIAEYLVIAVLVQVFVALLQFVFPALMAFLGQYILYEESVEIFSDMRLIGLGSQYFGAGLTNGFALLLIAYLIKNSCSSLIRMLYLIIAYILIFVLGMMMARTTIVGAILSVCFLFLKSSMKVNVRSLRRGLSVFFLLIGSFVLLSSLFSDIREKQDVLFDFAFEMFINYVESGEITTESTDRLQEMYVFPSNLSTWLIGDGLFSDPTGDGYYMQTDVGYLRIIYYSGLIGLLLFIFYQYLLIDYINVKTNWQNRLFLFFIFSYMLVCNIKGFTDLTSYCVLFMFCERKSISL